MPTPATIKDALRACTTEAEVLATANRYRADVRAMAADPTMKEHALIIANLKSYRLWEIRNPA